MQQLMENTLVFHFESRCFIQAETEVQTRIPFGVRAQPKVQAGAVVFPKRVHLS